MVAKLATGGFWLVALLSTLLLSVLQFCDDGKELQSAVLREIVNELYKNRLIVSIVLVGLQVIAAIGAWYFAWRSPCDVDKLQKTLNSLVEHFFADQEWETHQYRATIFQIRGIYGTRWAIGQWSGIFCRSGESYDRSNTIFYIDRMSKEKSTGIVGRCLFAEGQTILLDAVLPVGDEKEYKRLCHLADCEYNAMNVKSKLLSVTGIKRHGRLWGFLVLDTNDETQCPNQQTSKGKRRMIGAWAEVVGAFMS